MAFALIEALKVLNKQEDILRGLRGTPSLIEHELKNGCVTPTKPAKNGAAKKLLQRQNVWLHEQDV